MIKAPWSVETVSWIPNSGPLVITLENYLSEQVPIGSIYLPHADITIAMSALPTPPDGNPFYTLTPNGNNPQTVPMPAGTTQVTLTGASASTYYVTAASGIYRPLLEGSSLT